MSGETLVTTVPCGEGHICCDDPRQFPEHRRGHQHPDVCEECLYWRLGWRTEDDKRVVT